MCHPKFTKRDTEELGSFSRFHFMPLEILWISGGYPIGGWPPSHTFGRRDPDAQGTPSASPRRGGFDFATSVQPFDLPKQIGSRDRSGPPPLGSIFKFPFSTLKRPEISGGWLPSVSMPPTGTASCRAGFPLLGSILPGGQWQASPARARRGSNRTAGAQDAPPHPRAWRRGPSPPCGEGQLLDLGR